MCHFQRPITGGRNRAFYCHGAGAEGEDSSGDVLWFVCFFFFRNSYRACLRLGGMSPHSAASRAPAGPVLTARCRPNCPHRPTPAAATAPARRPQYGATWRRRRPQAGGLPRGRAGTGRASGRPRGSSAPSPPAALVPHPAERKPPPPPPFAARRPGRAYALAATRCQPRAGQVAAGGSAGCAAGHLRAAPAWASCGGVRGLPAAPGRQSPGRLFFPPRPAGRRCGRVAAVPRPREVRGGEKMAALELRPGWGRARRGVGGHRPPGRVSPRSEGWGAAPLPGRAAGGLASPLRRLPWVMPWPLQRCVDVRCSGLRADLSGATGAAPVRGTEAPALCQGL